MKTTALFFLLSSLLLSACPSSGDSWTSVPTDNGRWTLELDTEWGTGWQDIGLTVLDAGVAQDGLTLEADLTMPSMGHGSDELIAVTELGEGVYNVNGHFQMEGPWELSGSITLEDESDTFAVALDVVSE